MKDAKVTIRLRPEQESQLTAIAEKRGWTVSRVVRQAIEQLLEHEEGRGKVMDLSLAEKEILEAAQWRLEARRREQGTEAEPQSRFEKIGEILGRAAGTLLDEIKVQK